MKQPVLKARAVYWLLFHAPRNNRGINDADEPDQPPKNGGSSDRLPRRTQDRRQQQGDAEVNDVRGPKGSSGLGGGFRPFGNEGHYNELQSDQRACGRADDHVKTIPFGKF